MHTAPLINRRSLLGLVVFLGMLWGSVLRVPLQAQSRSGESDVEASEIDTTALDGHSDTSGRAHRWRQQRRAKAEALTSPEPGLFERVRRFVARTGGSVVPHRFILDVPQLEVAGIHPVLGGLDGSSGLAAGLLYEPPVFQGKGRLASVEAVAGRGRYYGTQGIAGMEGERYVGYAYGRYEHRPGERFFGVGAESTMGNESVYRLDEGLFGGLFGRSFDDRSLIGGHVSYQINRFGRGRGSLPQVAEQFGDTMPGVGADIDYLMVGGFYEIDTRDTPYDRAFGHRFAPTESRLRSVSLEATRGFYLAAEVTHNIDTRLNSFDFTRFTIDLREFIPITEGLMHGFSFRQFASVTRSSDGQVPFYRLQSIGGTRSLRGYANDRFQDRNVILVNAELRCQVWHWIDMALFADVGQVFRRVDTASFDEPKAGYGLGFRIRKDGQTLGRIDLAWSENGLTTHLDLGSLF